MLEVGTSFSHPISGKNKQNVLLILLAFAFNLHPIRLESIVPSCYFYLLYVRAYYLFYLAKEYKGQRETLAGFVRRYTMF